MSKEKLEVKSKGKGKVQFGRDLTLEERVKQLEEIIKRNNLK